MTLDEFLIAIGIKADTSGAKDAEKSLDGVKSSADSAEKSTSSFGAKFARVLRSVGAIAATAFAAIKGALIGAMGYLNSAISSYEELYNSKDKDLKITKEQYLAAKKYTEGVDKARKSIDGIKNRIAFAFLPTMLKMIESFNKFLDSNKLLISNGITKLLSALSYVSNAITNAIKFIDLIVKSTIGWDKALMALAIAFAFVKRAMIAAFITNPITWVVAALAGLVLLIDDFMTYLDGGESEFGEFWGAMIEWIEKVKAPVIALKDAFLGAFDAISEAFSVLVSAFSDNLSLSDIFSIDGKDTEDAEGAFVSIVNSAKDFFQFIADNKESIKSAAEFIGKAFAWAAKLIIGVLSGAGQVILGFIKYVISLFNLIVAAFSGDTEAMSQAWSDMTDSAISIFKGFLTIIGQVVDSILQIFGTNVESIKEYFNALYVQVKIIFNMIKSAISDKVDSILDKIKGVVKSIGDSFSSVFDTITAPFGQAFDWIMSKFSQLPNLLKGIVSSATFGLSDKIGGAISGVVNNSSKNTTVNGGAVNATFNVSSSNPAAAAKQTNSLLQSTNSMALRNATSGVKL